MQGVHGRGSACLKENGCCKAKICIHVCLARIGMRLLVLLQANACRSVSSCARPQQGQAAYGA